jgi:hypothetical protein
MKESRLIQMENQLKNVIGVQSAILSQISNLKDLSIGTLETLKRMKGYQEAVDQLKEDIQTGSGKMKTEEKELALSDGEIRSKEGSI